MVAQGLSNRQIAQDLPLRAHVENHVSKILGKLGLVSRAESPPGQPTKGSSPPTPI